MSASKARGHIDASVARRALLAACCALAALVVVELALRSSASRLSGNVAHIREFDRLLAEAGKSPGVRVVFVGNSLIGNAIAPATFKEVAREAGRIENPIKLVPDGTGIWDWRCIVSDHLPRAAAGDRVVIGFAWDQLSDQLPLAVSKTFGLICPLGEIRAVRTFHSVGIGDAIEAGFSRLSLAYTLRERLRNGALDRFVPDYQEQSRALNSDGVGRGGAHGAARAMPAHTYAALTDLVAQLRAKGYRPTFIAMPTVAGYELDPQIAHTLQANGAGFFDMRTVPALAARHFIDSIHLGQEGAELFTRSFATGLDDAPARAAAVAPAPLPLGKP
jgi:hypothetical protein